MIKNMLLLTAWINKFENNINDINIKYDLKGIKET